MAIIANVAVHDAAVLEFDFEATGDVVEFSFVFASEEYPEYVCGDVNDAFGFFLSGPGIDGGSVFQNNAINLATVPNTTPPVPVTINTVNPGVVGINGTNQNCYEIDPNWEDYSAYYIANDTQSNSSSVIEYDGFTVVLTAKTEVQCGEVYHIKMAIADGNDTSLDSAVFLEAGSFASSSIETNLLPSLGYAVNDSTIYEGCGDSVLRFTRPEGTDASTTITIDVSGSAQNGLDYHNLPNEVTFEEDQSEVEIVFQIPEDFLSEDIESVVLTISGETSCNSQNSTNEFVFYISDVDPLNVQINDKEIECGTPTVLDPVISGGIGEYKFLWDNGTIDSSIEVLPNSTTTYTLIVSDTCSVESVTESIIVIVPEYEEITLNIGDDLWISCVEERLISPQVLGGNQNYFYNWTFNSETIATSNELFQSFNESGELTLEVTDGCGNSEVVSIQIILTSKPIEIDIENQFLCLPGTAILKPEVSGGDGILSYNWIPGDHDELIYNVSLLTTTSYQITVLDQCGNLESVSMLLSVQDFQVGIGHSYEDEQTIALYNQANLPAELFWDVNSSWFSNEEAPTYQFDDPFESHTISLVGETSLGCRDSVSVDIYPPLIFYIPNSFTSDYDGRNDVFRVIGTASLDYEMLVFDRDGHLVFKSKDINDVWNGSVLGGNYFVQDGVYNHRVTAKGYRGEVFQKSGHINVLR